MPAWNESSPEIYRKLEQDQRALADSVSCGATREIHLEFAERYKKLAEELEAQAMRPEIKTQVGD